MLNTSFMLLLKLDLLKSKSNSIKTFLDITKSKITKIRIISQFYEILYI